VADNPPQPTSTGVMVKSDPPRSLLPLGRACSSEEADTVLQSETGAGMAGHVLLSMEAKGVVVLGGKFLEKSDTSMNEESALVLGVKATCCCCSS